MQREERFGTADRIVRIGFIVNAFLMVMKLVAGWVGNSAAVFADGMESAADFVAISATLMALSVSRQGFDDKHPYGHGKAENLAAMVVGVVILATGGWILYGAVTSILAKSYQKPEGIAVAAAVLTIVVKELLYRYTDRFGRTLDSPAVSALAKDHRKDAITSIATLIGVGFGYGGVPVLDPVAAGVTSIFIFHIGWETLSHAAHDLMDGQPPQEDLDRIISIVEEIDGVEHVHEIKGRRSGQYMIIDLKLDMDPEMTVKRSHDIAHRVKRVIFDCFPAVGDVMIHINPHDDPDHEDLIRL
ncbi:MAG: cation diffusion facilitator family transporter [Desulfuromonadia bacterium]